VPLIGDLFDVAYKSNLRNLALLERAIERPAATSRTSRLLVAAAFLGLVLLVAGGLVVTVLLVRAVAHAVSTG
jgi:short subunit fatty acids transporter